jgi:glycosyltransferase involved in cell wall biosynthesis
MRVWLVTIGEPLPSDGKADRLLRTGMLAEILVRRGHEVVWWTSTFDHARKRQRFEQDTAIPVAANYSIRLIHAPSYPQNVCLRRWFNHRILAKRFARLASNAVQPDIILSSLPTVELCLAAIEYARPRRVPVAIDIRDLWPEVFVDLSPKWLHAPTRLALTPLFAELNTVCRQAQGIVGTTQQYIDWTLQHANRLASTWDQPFPLGYRSAQSSKADLQSADAFWNQQGIAAESQELTCCYFGTMGRHCTLETVLNAARVLQHNGSRVRFVLCGAGDKLPHYRQIAQGCASVIFPGWVDAAQIQALMNRSSVGLAPYLSNTNYRQNIPNKPIEYLSAGLPIVSSLQGVVQNVIDQHDCGVTYANNDVQGLAAILGNLANTPDRVRDMSRNAHHLYQRQFNADVVYGGMADYLESLAQVPTVPKHIGPRHHVMTEMSCSTG